MTEHTPDSRPIQDYWLYATTPELIEAIEKAGRIVGQVLDSPKMSLDQRSYALSRAFSTLGPIYFKTTGQPLEWWQYEDAIAKARGE
jgi:hypothetical protein